MLTTDAMEIDVNLWYSPSTGQVWTKRKDRRLNRSGALREIRQKNKYGKIQYKGRALFIHRVAWEVLRGSIPDKMVVDHINGDSRDNRISNLQCVSQMENCQKMRTKSSNTSGYPGVSWRKGRMAWTAYITVNYRHMFLGNFKTAIEAYSAYREAKLKGHGQQSIAHLG